jgi:uncharacterized protein YgiM (DUF1202 family)
VAQRKPTSVIAGRFILTEPEKTTAVAAITPVPAVQEKARALPTMYVSSRSVNVRQGPSTDYEVVDRLTHAEAVTVVSPEQDGWVQIRIEGDGIEGFIAARLLADTDPAAH